MNLLRLPLLVLTDVFKNMDFKEKVETEGSYNIGGEEIRLSFLSNTICLQQKTIQKRLLLANCVLDIFNKPTISKSFQNPTVPSSAIKFMKMINQRKLCIKSFDYSITTPSSEFIKQILNECTEVTDSVSMDAEFPDDFVYIPPRPFKTTKLYVIFTISTNWLNLEYFMNCRRITLHIGANSNRTPKSWNTFLRNWIDSDSPLEDFAFYYIERSNFLLIVNGLSNEGIQQRGDDEWIDVKRKNGSEFVIGRNGGCIYIWTKQAHLEHLRRQEQ
uniref:F-box domain-containing protein n=1 Tax=Caenorhabditis tropicalis TaxID=1561998 RepID=A0A1I7UTP1_9PELO